MSCYKIYGSIDEVVSPNFSRFWGDFFFFENRCLMHILMNYVVHFMQQESWNIIYFNYYLYKIRQVHNI